MNTKIQIYEKLFITDSFEEMQFIKDYVLRICLILSNILFNLESRLYWLDPIVLETVLLMVFSPTFRHFSISISDRK